LVFGCNQKEKENISKAYLLKEFQDSNEINSFHRFPILKEAIFNVDQITKLNQLLENKNNFDEFGKKCFEPEVGFKIIKENKIIKSVLVSMECSQVYIYQNNRKSELFLSQLGKDNFQLFLHEIFLEKK
jgi:hypothetical protein